MGDVRSISLFICPKCKHALTKYGVITLTKVCDANTGDEIDRVSFDDEEGPVTEIPVICPRCYSFIDMAIPEDYIVEVYSDSILEIGSYWDSNRLPKEIKITLEELKEIVSKVSGRNVKNKKGIELVDMLLRKGIPLEIVDTETVAINGRSIVSLAYAYI